MSDDAPLAALLTEVLGRRVDGSELQVHRPSGGGWSNDTAIITLADGLRVVARRAPERAAMFPTYDLRREHDCLRALAAVVPVPSVIGADLTGDVVGRPAFVRVDVPTDSARDGMLWGDARPANVICGVDGFEPVALVDFELAAWGPPELDVTWLAEMDRMRTVASGIAPLPGFLDDDGAVAFYEACARRPLAPDVLRWATLFNALKVSVLMHRHLRVTVHDGRLPGDHRIFTENVSTRRCAELLDAR